MWQEKKKKSEKTHLHAEENVANSPGKHARHDFFDGFGDFLFCFYWFFNFQCPRQACWKIWEEMFTLFFYYSFLFLRRRRRSGAGGVSATLNRSERIKKLFSFLRRFVTIFFFFFFLCRADLFLGLVALLLPSAHTFLLDESWWNYIYIYILNNNNNTNKTICKQSPVVIVVTLQVCAKVYVCIWMYVLEDFLETFFVFYLFIDSLGATGVHCELYSEGLDIPSFIDFRNAEH